jgi:hypothetical protein
MGSLSFEEEKFNLVAKKINETTIMADNNISLILKMDFIVSLLLFLIFR